MHIQVKTAAVAATAAVSVTINDTPILFRHFLKKGGLRHVRYIIYSRIESANKSIHVCFCWLWGNSK